MLYAGVQEPPPPPRSAAAAGPTADAASAAAAAAADALGVSFKYRIQDAVGQQIQNHDPEQALDSADFHEILAVVTDKVLAVAAETGRVAMVDDDDRFILPASVWS